MEVVISPFNASFKVETIAPFMRTPPRITTTHRWRDPVIFRAFTQIFFSLVAI